MKDLRTGDPDVLVLNLENVVAVMWDKGGIPQCYLVDHEKVFKSLTIMLLIQ